MANNNANEVPFSTLDSARGALRCALADINEGSVRSLRLATFSLGRADAMLEIASDCGLGGWEIAELRSQVTKMYGLIAQAQGE